MESCSVNPSLLPLQFEKPIHPEEKQQKKCGLLTAISSRSSTDSPRQ